MEFSVPLPAFPLFVSCILRLEMRVKGLCSCCKYSELYLEELRKKKMNVGCRKERYYCRKEGRSNGWSWAVEARHRSWEVRD